MDGLIGILVYIPLATLQCSAQCSMIASHTKYEECSHLILFSLTFQAKANQNREQTQIKSMQTIDGEKIVLFDVQTEWDENQCTGTDCVKLFHQRRRRRHISHKVTF